METKNQIQKDNIKVDQILKKYKNIPKNILDDIIFPSGEINSIFHKNIKTTYADFIGSGLPSPTIENYIKNHVYPFYANTHSNARNGTIMNNMIEGTKEMIRNKMNLTNDYQIIFVGSGATGASNLLVNSLDFSKFDEVNIFITLYEHYSNYLPWFEASKTNNNIKINFISFDSSKENAGILDLDKLKSDIININTNAIKNKKNNLVICSVSACSNVNGLITPLNKIREIYNEIKCDKYFTKYLFADYACSAPYVDIDGSLLDGFFFSPHKFIGGVSTPGILICKSCVFMKDRPFCPGGGCVINASSKKVEYETDIEKREMAGTPNIVGIIKISKILQLKDFMRQTIKNNEDILSTLIKYKIDYLTEHYPTFKAVLYNDDQHHLPILSFHLTDIHYNLIVVLLNDLFGIQTRGGFNCCGLLAEYIEKKYKYRGWCRVSFHWLMDKNTIINIFRAIELIIIKGKQYQNLYDYNEEHNLFRSKKK